jgi:hypothetical protein
MAPIAATLLMHMSAEVFELCLNALSQSAERAQQAWH